MRRSMKQMNAYTDLIDPRFYARIPKAVLAAIAVSYIVNLQGTTMTQDDVTAALRDEWSVLHTNGLVPQRAK